MVWEVWGEVVGVVEGEVVGGGVGEVVGEVWVGEVVEVCKNI